MQSLCSEETDTAAEEDAEGSGEIYDPPPVLGVGTEGGGDYVYRCSGNGRLYLLPLIILMNYSKNRRCQE